MVFMTNYYGLIDADIDLCFRTDLVLLSECGTERQTDRQTEIVEASGKKKNCKMNSCESNQMKGETNNDEQFA